MASLDLGKLKISVELDNENANKGLDETADKVDNVEKKGGSGLKKFGVAAAAGFAAVGTATIAASKELWNVANAAATTADEIDKTSQKVGMSKEGFQEWKYILGQNGVEISTLEKGMKSFSSVVDGTSTAGVAAMDKLGISIEGMSKEEAWNATVAALQGVTDETQKLSIATDLFGAGAAQNMMPMLNQTVESTGALKQNAHDLGIVLTDEAVNAGVTFGDTLSDLQQAVSGVGNQLGVALMPILTQVMSMIIAQMPTITAMIQQFTPMITALFESLIPSITQIVQDLLPIIIELIAQIMPLVAEMFTALLPPLLQLIQALLPPLTQLLSAILPVIISLIKMLTPLFQPIISLLTPILQLAIAILTPLMQMINSILPPITSLISKLISGALTPLSAAFTTVGNVLTTVFKAAFVALTPILDNFKTILNGIITFITGVFSGNWGKAWSGVKDVFSGIVSGLGNIFKAPINFIISGINTFIRGLNKIKIPDWVPAVGGKGFHISEIPMLAKGGNIEKSGAAIVGEAGAELIELPKGASVTPLSNSQKGNTGTNNVTQNNYFTQKELSPYQAQLEVKRLSRNLAGAF